MTTCSKCQQEHDRDGRYCADCHAEYMREWRKTHRLDGEARKRSNARNYARVYLKRGKIVRLPCQKCGAPESEMHHPDHELPLEEIDLKPSGCGRTHKQQRVSVRGRHVQAEKCRMRLAETPKWKKELGAYRKRKS